MKTIILARVSTEEQMTEGQSIPAQIRRLKNYCLQKKLNIVKEFSFDESAYKTRRSEFDSILDFIKKQREKIVVCFDKVDRFSRNVFDKRVSILYDLAMQDKIELHFASDNLVINSDISAVEKFHFGINLGLAKYYSDAISDNVKRTFELKIRNGEWPRPAPIGYINSEDEKGNKTIVPDPEKAHFIKMAFKLYASGQYTLHPLARKLKKEGLRRVRPPYTEVKHNRLHAILQNSFYYGEMFIKGKFWPHNYEPLITKELFEECQRVRLGWHKKSFNYGSIPFPFRGIIRCAECGRVITGERKKGKYNYYRCTKYTICGSERITEADLITQVEKVLKKLKMPDYVYQKQIKILKDSHKNKTEYYQNAVGSLKQEHAKLENNIEILYQDRLDGRITTEEYDKKAKLIKNKQADILLQIENHDKADKVYYLTATRLLDLSQRAYEVFQSSKANQKRQILDFLLLNCRLKGQKLLFNLKEPFDYIYLCSKSQLWRARRELNPRSQA